MLYRSILWNVEIFSDMVLYNRQWNIITFYRRIKQSFRWYVNSNSCVCMRRMRFILYVRFDCSLKSQIGVYSVMCLQKVWLQNFRRCIMASNCNFCKKGNNFRKSHHSSTTYQKLWRKNIVIRQIQKKKMLQLTFTNCYVKTKNPNFIDLDPNPEFHVCQTCAPSKKKICHSHVQPIVVI